MCNLRAEYYINPQVIQWCVGEGLVSAITTQRASGFEPRAAAVQTISDGNACLGRQRVASGRLASAVDDTRMPISLS